MRILLICLITSISFAVQAQKKIEKTISLEDQNLVDIQIDFADEIKVNTWERSEVFVRATVSINGGEDNDIFELKTRTSASRVKIEMDKAIWEDKTSNNKRNCWETEIYVEVFLPKNLEISMESIFNDF